MRTTRTLAAFAVAGLVAAPTTALAANGRPHVGIGIRLLDAPSNLVRDPRAHSYVIDALRPGATITRHVEVSNDTGHAARILLYPDSATISGGRFVATEGHGRNELTSWTTVTPSSLDLPQGGSVTATVVVHVPTEVTNGERYAVILADLPPTSSAPGVHVESRVGIRMYVDVTHSGTPVSNFTIDTLTASRAPDGRPVVEAQVHNIGQRALDMTGALALADGPGGLSAGPFPAVLGTTLAPGQSEPVTVVLDRALPAGPWHARIDLRSGLLRRAAEGVITFPSAPGTSAAPVKAEPVPLTRNRHVLVPVAIGLILLLLALFVLYLLWRRRRDDDDEDSGGSPAPAPAVPAQRGRPRERVRQ